MKNYIQPGKIVSLTAPATIASGDGVLVGSLFGVAVNNAAAGAPAEIQLEGVFELPKADDDLSEGEALFWDDAARRMTSTATDNTEAAKAVKAAAPGAAVVRARLNG